MVDVGRAAAGVRIGRGEVRALGRPRRDQIQVRGQRPGVRGREHLVLQHVVARIRPVVRDLGGRVIPHHVGHPGVVGLRVRALLAHLALGARLHPVERRDEPVHRAAVDVVPTRPLVVRAALVVLAGVVVRLPARALVVPHAHRERTVRVARDPVRTGERPEVRVERAVLLDHEDEVVDVVDAELGVDRPRVGRRDRDRGRVGRRIPTVAAPRVGHDEERDHADHQGGDHEGSEEGALGPLRARHGPGW